MNQAEGAAGAKALRHKSPRHHGEEARGARGVRGRFSGQILKGVCQVQAKGTSDNPQLPLTLSEHTHYVPSSVITPFY